MSNPVLDNFFENAFAHTKTKKRSREVRNEDIIWPITSKRQKTKQLLLKEKEFKVDLNSDMCQYQKSYCLNKANKMSIYCEVHRDLVFSDVGDREVPTLDRDTIIFIFKLAFFDVYGVDGKPIKKIITKERQFSYDKRQKPGLYKMINDRYESFYSRERCLKDFNNIIIISKSYYKNFEPLILWEEIALSIIIRTMPMKIVPLFENGSRKIGIKKAKKYIVSYLEAKKMKKIKHDLEKDIFMASSTDIIISID